MFKLFKNLTKKDWLLMIVVVCLIVFQVWLDLKMPDYMSEITQLVQTEGSEMGEILKNGGYMLACAFGSLAAAVFTGFLTSNISASFSKNTRKALFDKIESLSMQEIKGFSVSSLITRSTNDITQIQMFVAMGLQMLIKAPITAVWAVTKILNKSWQWSAVTGGAIVILIFVIGFLISVVLPNFRKVQKMTDNLNGVVRENLTGIRVVRAFNAEKYQKGKLKVANDDLTNLQMFNQRMFAILSPVMYLVMYGLTLSIYFVGAFLIDGALITDKIGLFGDMVVFSSYSMQVIMAFLMLAMIFMIYPRASVSANRINEVMDTDISVKNGNLKENKTGEVGTVEFRNVNFRYKDGDEDLLENISFRVNKGETLAIIGATGSGKSTLINMIPRFYDATEGEVLVDGVNVKEYDQEFLNNKIGYVSQKAVIFNDSIKNNVAYGENGKEKITDDKVKEAVRVAQGTDFIEKMDDQYETILAAGGTNVSGGQKQRISIARAVARDPEIYIFDDTFSALDYKTDTNLRRELKKYTKDATTIIVAQRIGTIMHADNIIVLEDGNIVGYGKHNDLLKNCEVYKEIALSQLSEEELKNG